MKTLMMLIVMVQVLIIRMCRMKIRNGFVSNSSSSSFVIYGFPITKLPLGIQRALDGMDYIPDVEIDIGGCTDLFVGTIIHSYANEYTGEVKIIEDFEVDDTPEELEADRQLVKNGFKEYYGIDIPDEWFKTYYLEYYS